MDRRHLFCALFSVSLLAACGVEGDDDVSSDSYAIVRDYTGVNGLDPEDEMASHPDSLLLLGQTFKQSPVTRGMYDTAHGKYTLAKQAYCGLPAGQVVTITNSRGTSNQFRGHIGVLPKWTTDVPTPSQRRWQWGCMGAMLNAYGTPVEISLRGNNAAYHPGVEELKNFGFEEAAWFGEGDDLYAVVGKDLWTLCGVASVPQLEKRVCVRATPTSPGCPNVTVLGRWDQVCSVRDGDKLSGCKVGTKVFNEVTVNYLRTNTITTCEDYAP